MATYCDQLIRVYFDWCNKNFVLELIFLHRKYLMNASDYSNLHVYQ